MVNTGGLLMSDSVRLLLPATHRVSQYCLAERAHGGGRNGVLKKSYI